MDLGARDFNAKSELIMKSSEKEMAALIKIYVCELPAKAAEIQQAAETAIHQLGKRETPRWAVLESLVHKLAGSAGTYGFYAISTLARTLEDRISNGSFAKIPPDEQALELRGWLESFLTVARKTATDGESVNKEAA
ncbi:MAG: Hpt domain-containing protein [Bdellovibrionota bacterium]